MINIKAENKVADYLKSVVDLAGENIISGVSDGKRELPCIVVHCDSANSYPNVTPEAGLYVLSMKVIVMQSNTEDISLFKARSEKIHSALASRESIKSFINNSIGTPETSLFVYGSRELRTEPAVEEMHFLTTYSFEIVAS